MRNFPHQVNDIQKLRRALQVADELIRQSQPLSDDSVLGYTLARQRVYTFRGLDDPTPELEYRIAQEQAKSLANQGARTFARDLRRTLVLLGFLESHLGEHTLSDSGTRLLELPDVPHPESTALWINAVLRLEIGSDTSPTHPATNMLKIVQSVPDVEKPWLAFALDMDNDSQQESRPSFA